MAGSENAESVPLAAEKSGSSSSDSVRAAVDRQSANPYRADLTHVFDGWDFYVAGSLVGIKKGKPYKSFVFQLYGEGRKPFTQTARQLEQSGYQVQRVSDCYARIFYKGGSFNAFCGSPKSQQSSGA